MQPAAQLTPAFAGNVARQLNKSTDPSGFVIGFAVNPTGCSLSHSLRSAVKRSRAMAKSAIYLEQTNGQRLRQESPKP